MADEEDGKSWLLPSEIPFDELKEHALDFHTAKAARLCDETEGLVITP